MLVQKNPQKTFKINIFQVSHLNELPGSGMVGQCKALSGLFQQHHKAIL